MDYEKDLVADAIRRIIRNAPWHHVKIEGRPSAKWFVLRDAHLAPFVSSSTSDIMVKFAPDHRITILIPDHIAMNSRIEPYMCSLFLGKKAFEGWQEVCPYLTEQVADACLLNIAVLLQFVQNPILCGIHGCDRRIAYEKLMADFEPGFPRDGEEDFKY